MLESAYRAMSLHAICSVVAIKEDVTINGGDHRVMQDQARIDVTYTLQLSWWGWLLTVNAVYNKTVVVWSCRWSNVLRRSVLWAASFKLSMKLAFQVTRLKRVDVGGVRYAGCWGVFRVSFKTEPKRGICWHWLVKGVRAYQRSWGYFSSKWSSGIAEWMYMKVFSTYKRKVWLCICM